MSAGLKGLHSSRQKRIAQAATRQNILVDYQGTKSDDHNKGMLLVEGICKRTGNQITVGLSPTKIAPDAPHQRPELGEITQDLPNGATLLFNDAIEVSEGFFRANWAKKAVADPNSDKEKAMVVMANIRALPAGGTRQRPLVLINSYNPNNSSMAKVNSVAEFRKLVEPHLEPKFGAQGNSSSVMCRLHADGERPYAFFISGASRKSQEGAYAQISGAQAVDAAMQQDSLKAVMEHIEKHGAQLEVIPGMKFVMGSKSAADYFHNGERSKFMEHIHSTYNPRVPSIANPSETVESFHLAESLVTVVQASSGEGYIVKDAVPALSKPKVFEPDFVPSPNYNSELLAQATVEQKQQSAAPESTQPSDAPQETKPAPAKTKSAPAQGSSEVDKELGTELDADDMQFLNELEQGLSTPSP